MPRSDRHDNTPTPRSPRRNAPPRPSPHPPEPRRALSQLGGQVELQGYPREARALAEVWHDLESLPVDVLTHNFHTWPARLHPAIPGRLLAQFSRPGDTVLDPFCGGGTTLLEALLAGCRPIGFDINPVALNVARVRTLCLTDDQRAALLEHSQRIADETFEDARHRRPVKLGAAALHQREWYAPHTLFELQGLHNRITHLEDPLIQAICLMVFSSILVKVSLQSGDTTAQTAPRQLGRGFTARLFGRKAEELERNLAALAQTLPPRVFAPRLQQADARALPLPDGSVDLVITSPPYVGTYEYTAFQERRLEWLGLDARFAHDHEIGTRDSEVSAQDIWREDMADVLLELGRVVRPGGWVVLVAADGVMQQEVYRVDRETGPAAQGSGLSLIAIASEARPHFHGPTRHLFADRPRMEHLILLQKER